MRTNDTAIGEHSKNAMLINSNNVEEEVIFGSDEIEIALNFLIDAI